MKGQYYYYKGLNIRALIVLIAGIIVGFFIPPYLIGSLVSIAFSGIFYTLLMYYQPDPGMNTIK